MQKTDWWGEAIAALLGFTGAAVVLYILVVLLFVM